LQLPVNTVIQNLYLGGNKLDTTVLTSLISQITAMTNLRDLRFSAGTPLLNNIENGQNSTNGIGALNLSALTLLQTLYINKSAVTGVLTVSNTLIRLYALDNTITGIAGAGSFAALTDFAIANNPGFDFDFTRLPAVRGIRAEGCNITVLDLSNRTSTAQWYRNTEPTEFAINLNSNPNLTSVIFAAFGSMTLSGIGEARIYANNCPLLTSVTNQENISYSGASADRYFNFVGCALDIDFKIGTNNFVPTTVSIHNNGMSVANVDVNINNVHTNRRKWDTLGLLSRQLNIGGTNGAATGTYGAPSGYKSLTITGITKAATAVVTVSSIGSLANNDVVRIRSVGGMAQVNNQYFMVKNISGNTFELYNEAGTTPINSTAFGTYTSAGFAQVESTPASAKEQIYVLVNVYQWTITYN
jgi:hypothetical protein